MPPTIAVTGANGHIGNVVCRTLLEKGFQVRALYHSDARSLKGLSCTCVKGNVLKKGELYRLMEGCDAVIHCAAIISIEGDPTGYIFKTNTEGPVNVLEVAQELGVKKLLHISSTHAVMEVPTTGVFDERRPYKTSDAFAYDHSKAQGEQLLLAAALKTNVEVVILRPSSVVGPFDFKPSEMGKALMDFYREKIPFLQEGGYNFVDVRDVAHSIVSALDSGKNREIYLLSGKYYSMNALGQVIASVTGKRVPTRTIPFRLLELSLPLISMYSRLTGAAPLFTIESITALKNGHPNMDYSKAAVQLGHQCRDLAETLRDFYSWNQLPLSDHSKTDQKPA